MSNAQMKNIFLVGFMGTGKSTVAIELSQITGKTVMEMDEAIVKQQGKPISKIFQEDGEEFFRGLETQLLRDMQTTGDYIVSCGGGVPMRQENVDLMKDCGTIVLLTADAATIQKRVASDNTRPLLEGKKTVEDIQALMEKRQDKYMAAADVVIATDEKSATAIAEEIKNYIEG